MTPSPGPARSGRSAALGRALLDVQRTATTASEVLLNLVPDTGDHATGRAVDDFVEQASDALRALEESVLDTMRRLDAPGPSISDGAAPGSALDAAHHSTQDGAPRGWGW